MRVIFAGTIGRSGLGGQAWASLQYLLGLRALGHEVFYLEDCGESSWVYNWAKQEWTVELDYPAAYVRACLEPFGLGEQWIYRASQQSVGASLPRFREFCATADLLLMRAVPLWVWRTEYEQPRRRAFLDVDPGFTQITIANGDRGWAEGVARCERRFTLGHGLGSAHCPIPAAGGPWLETLPPVFLAQWPRATWHATHFTTIIRWQGLREVTHHGIAYGQRDKEFPRYLDLPERTPQKFCIALLGAQPEYFTRHGWEVAPGEIISKTPASYREFIQSSRAEFSVPKHGYVASRSGWMSDRSVCYLASGRPVVIEETGLSDWLPTGEGLITFRDPRQALDSIERINADYPRHGRAARELAERFFAAEHVLPRLLEAAMN